MSWHSYAPPSFHNGYATSQGEAEFPELWPSFGWAPFLGPQGGTLREIASGRKHDGTLTNMDPGTDWTVARGRQSIKTDIVSKHVSVAHSTALTPASFTVAGWFVRLANLHPNGAGVVAKHSGSLGYMLFVDTGASGVIGWFLNATNVSSAVSTVIGQIYFAVGTYDGTTGRIFVDGIEKASGAATVTDSAGIFALSRYAAVDNTGLDGNILDAYLYDRVISKNQISQLYSLGPGGWAIPRQRRWNALGAAQLAQAAYVVGGGISVPGGVT